MALQPSDYRCMWDELVCVCHSLSTLPSILIPPFHVWLHSMSTYTVHRDVIVVLQCLCKWIFDAMCSICHHITIVVHTKCHMASNDMTIFQPIDLLVHTSMAAFSVDSTAFHMVRLAPLPGPRSIHLCISISGILPKFPLEMGRALCVARRIFAEGIFVLISFDLHKPCWHF